ncbi:hypothetical protein ABPG77_009139 [Micractinium sp. CCAP 211/92]
MIPSLPRGGLSARPAQPCAWGRRSCGLSRRPAPVSWRRTDQQRTRHYTAFAEPGGGGGSGKGGGGGGHDSRDGSSGGGGGGGADNGGSGISGFLAKSENQTAVLSTLGTVMSVGSLVLAEHTRNKNERWAAEMKSEADATAPERMALDSTSDVERLAKNLKCMAKKVERLANDVRELKQDYRGLRDKVEILFWSVCLALVLDRGGTCGGSRSGGSQGGR